MKHFANFDALKASGLLPLHFGTSPAIPSGAAQPIASFGNMHGARMYVWGSNELPKSTAEVRLRRAGPKSAQARAEAPARAPAPSSVRRPAPPLPPPDPAVAAARSIARALFVSEETALGREVTGGELDTVLEIALNRANGLPDGHRLPSAHARAEQLRASLGLGNIRRGVVASGHRLIIGAAIPSATPPKAAPVAAPKPRDDRRLSSGVLLSEVRAKIGVGSRAGGVVVTAKSLILGVPKSSSASPPSARIEKAGRGR